MTVKKTEASSPGEARGGQTCRQRAGGERRRVRRPGRTRLHSPAGSGHSDRVRGCQPRRARCLAEDGAQGGEGRGHSDTAAREPARPRRARERGWGGQLGGRGGEAGADQILKIFSAYFLKN